jgi:hypothetical protein
MEKNPLQSLPKVSPEAIIETIRMLRDNHINELLKTDEALFRFLKKHYDTVAISPIKKEFLKRDLIELKKTSLDLVHYSSLIKETKERGGMELAGSHRLFIQELNVIFQKYGF